MLPPSGSGLGEGLRFLRGVRLVPTIETVPQPTSTRTTTSDRYVKPSAGCFAPTQRSFGGGGVSSAERTLRNSGTVPAVVPAMVVLVPAVGNTNRGNGMRPARLAVLIVAVSAKLPDKSKQR